MAKRYARINWTNTNSTLLNATNLNKMDKGIDDIDDTLELKLDKASVVNNQSTTEAGFAADARQLNPSEDGSFAYNVNHSVSGADLIVEESVVSGRGVILEKKNNEIKFSGYYTMPVTSAQVKVGTLPKGYRVRVNKYVPVAIRRDTAYNTGYLALATDGSFYVRGATGTEFYFDTCYNIL